MSFVNRVYGITEMEEISQEWPRNIDWFDRDDYLISFTELLLKMAGMYAPVDGLLVRLGGFFNDEMP